VILADTSAWVEYDRATGSPVDARVAQLIADGGPLAVTEPVVMEVLAGARTDDREVDLRSLLLRSRSCASTLPQISTAPCACTVAAARLASRRADCMIAAVAWRRGATILAYDADLDRVARVIGIDVDPASHRAP